MHKQKAWLAVYMPNNTLVGIAKVALGGYIRVDTLVGIQELLLWG